MRRIIIVEGNISAGKSTLCRNLAHRLKAEVLIEPSLENPYLARFYANPKRYALTMQIYLLRVRFQAYIQAIKMAKEKNQDVILDRSIFSDFVFAYKNYKDGNISENGFQYYMKMRRQMIEHIPLPHCVLYLDVKPSVCLHRIKEVRKIEDENVIPLSYLEGLEEAYMGMLNDLKKMKCNIIFEDWNDFKSEEVVLPKILQQSSAISDFVQQSWTKVMDTSKYNDAWIQEKMYIPDVCDELYFDSNFSRSRTLDNSSSNETDFMEMSD